MPRWICKDPQRGGGLISDLLPHSPGGAPFEIATSEPGFARDEDVSHPGERLQIPGQPAHLRGRVEKLLTTPDG
ncbi:hypothetical protein H5395_16140 [Paracoccus sp. MC1854]|uniref:hypothetical protein n=1 Tax=Paracoccus sp. MC1854 TaxID=2760306 RepID=UPI00160385BB|nr:hypothetical protein [Paracoccus sp. MC1854]MBB1493012.1 hypothetical protein [Paracoccus sp. MC1854]